MNEDIIKQLGIQLGSANITIAVLQVQLAAAQRRIAELEGEKQDAEPS